MSYAEAEITDIFYRLNLIPTHHCKGGSTSASLKSLFAFANITVRFNRRNKAKLPLVFQSVTRTTPRSANIGTVANRIAVATMPKMQAERKSRLASLLSGYRRWRCSSAWPASPRHTGHKASQRCFRDATLFYLARSQATWNSLETSAAFRGMIIRKLT